MTKDQLQKIYNELYNILGQFNSGKDLYDNGSNKDKRARGSRIIDESINTAERLINNIPEILSIVNGGDDSDLNNRAFKYDEFFSHQFFRRDLTKLLDKIEENIKESPE